MHHFAQFGMVLARGRPADGLNKFDVRCPQTFAQHALTHHASSAEQQDYHETCPCAAVGQRTPVNCSETFHSRAATVSSMACRATKASATGPLSSKKPFGP